MLEVQPKDSRGYFVLPQKHEEAGYHTYGTPPGGAGQYAHPKLLSLIFMIEHRWQEGDNRKIGIGYEGHRGHKSGRDVDIRLVRKDGEEMPVTRFDAQYDQEATARLIGLLFESNIIDVIFFNDPMIPGVRPLGRHDDHFHVTIRE
jgi:penicillin-insensitive murein endopeptidase